MNASMKLSIAISNTSDIPIYRQLYDQIAAAVIKGDIAPNECLPTIRSFASELGISVITVKRTWEELERSGLISTVQGKGCFVMSLSEEERNSIRRDMAVKHIKNNIAFYKSLGLSSAELISIIKQEY